MTPADLHADQIRAVAAFVPTGNPYPLGDHVESPALNSEPNTVKANTTTAPTNKPNEELVLHEGKRGAQFLELSSFQVHLAF